MIIHILLSALLSIAAIPTKGQDNLSYAVDRIDKNLTKRANVVVRKDDSVITLESNKKYEAKYHRVLTIMNKKGEGFEDFRAYYKEGSDKIYNIDLKYYDANGRLIRAIKKKEIEDFIAHDGMSMISDQRLKLYDYEAVSYPITVEAIWHESSSSTLSLPGWRPLMGNNISVESSTFELINPSNIEVRMGARNMEEFAIEQVSPYKYVMRDQKSISRERYSPSYLEKYPMLYLAPTEYQYEGYAGQYHDWNEYGKWMHHTLLGDKADLDTEQVRKALDPIVKIGLKKNVNESVNKKNIVKRLYDYVQENTRYVLIGLDEGGLVPLSAQKVHDVKYGDCKALSFYMKSILELYDIKANYVIIRAESDMPEDIFEDYPHVAPANHVIINVPLQNDTIWLDCTSHNNPFNFLGSFTDDRLALQINEDGGQLVKTPKYGAELNKNIVTGQVDILSSGDITAQLDIDDYGIRMNNAFYLQSLDPKEYDEYLTGALFKKFDELKIEKQSLSIDEEEIKGTQSYQLSASKYAELAGDYMILEAALLPMSIPRLKKDSNRENELLFPREKKYHSSITYLTPPGYRWAVPDAIQIDSKYGSYSQKVEVKTRGVYTVERQFVLHKGKYPPEEYNIAKVFFDKIRKAEKTKISINNKS